MRSRRASAFPGEFEDGHVIRPGNLSRLGGVGTEIDADLDRLWMGFALEETLRRRRPVATCAWSTTRRSPRWGVVAERGLNWW